MDPFWGGGGGGGGAGGGMGGGDGGKGRGGKEGEGRQRPRSFWVVSIKPSRQTSTRDHKREMPGTQVLGGSEAECMDLCGRSGPEQETRRGRVCTEFCWVRVGRTKGRRPRSSLLAGPPLSLSPRALAHFIAPSVWTPKPSATRLTPHPHKHSPTPHRQDRQEHRKQETSRNKHTRRNHKMTPPPSVPDRT